MSKKINSLMLGMVIAPLAVPMQSVFADTPATNTNAEEAQKATNADESKVKVDTGLKTVTSVNGNKLVKDQAVVAGDTATFDIVYFPGNKGLMTKFEDTLPEGLKFDPSSSAAISVFAVNNDGTIGDDITKDGKTVINGKKATWTPGKPVNYLFVGSKGTQNRLLFHVTTKVVGNTSANSKLTNIANVENVNPKSKEHYDTTDTATVHTPGVPKSPSIHKNVFAEDDKGNVVDSSKDTEDKDDTILNAGTDKDLAAKDDNKSDDKDNAQMVSGAMDTAKDSDDTIREKVSTLVKAAKEYKIDTTKLESAVDKADKKKMTDDQKKAIFDEFTAVHKEYAAAFDKEQVTSSISTSDKDEDIKSKSNKLIADAKEAKVDTSKLEKLIADASNPMTADQKSAIVKEFAVVGEAYAKSGGATTGKEDGKTNLDDEGWEAGNDTLDLKDHDDLYTYVVTNKIPSQSVKKSLTIQDNIENVQAIDAKNVHIYNTSGEEITDKGKVSIKKQSHQNQISWKASDDFIKELKQKNENVKLTMKIQHVTLKGASKDDEQRYVVGGRVTVPNVANLITDGTPYNSNETIVRPPENPENPTSTITKGVMLEDGAETANNADSVTPDGTEPVNSKVDINWDETTKDNVKDNVEKVRVAAGLDSNADKDKVDSLTKAYDAYNADKSDENLKAVTEAASALQDSLSESNKAGDEDSKTDDTDKKSDAKTDSKTVDFETGQASAELPNHDSLYKYLINIAVNPDAVSKSMVFEDKMENVQKNSIKAENVHIYDMTGQDVTKDFKVEVGSAALGTQTDVKATANKDLVKKVHNSKENQKFHMVIGHVSLKGATDKDEAPFIHNGKVEVPNVANMVLDGHNTDSNKTLVTPPTPDKPNPDNPDKPGTPGTPGTPNTPQNPLSPSQMLQNPGQAINTGLWHLKRSPLALFAVIAAAIAAIGGVAWKTGVFKKFRKD